MEMIYKSIYYGGEEGETTEPQQAIYPSEPKGN
jgi:hypothetical protein